MAEQKKNKFLLPRGVQSALENADLLNYELIYSTDGKKIGIKDGAKIEWFANISDLFSGDYDDLINKPNIPTIPDMETNIIGTGNVISDIQVDPINKHKINIIKSDLKDGDGLTDAPSDGKLYGRKDGNWSEVVAGGGNTLELAHALCWDDPCDLVSEQQILESLEWG